MEFRQTTRTQSLLHVRPCGEIARKAQEYTEKYKVWIEIYNLHAKDCQEDFAEGIYITELLLMALGPESKLEIVVKGDNPVDILQKVAHGMAEVISRKYPIPTSDILRQ
jgi:phosphotransferase system HPr-like phosphotransfer protein